MGNRVARTRDGYEMNAIFVYWNKLGEIQVRDITTAHTLEDDPDWEHIATLDPVAYLQITLNNHPKIVAELRKANRA